MPKTNITIDVQFLDDRWKQIIDTQLVENIIQKASDLEHSDNFEISICLADNSKVQELNKEYRGKDKPTNVLSFPNEPLSSDIKDEQVLLGDIILSYDKIESEALEQNKAFVDHAIHMIVHGFLHLLGYDHLEEDEASIMESQEIKILSALNINDPYLEMEQ